MDTEMGKFTVAVAAEAQLEVRQGRGAEVEVEQGETTETEAIRAVAVEGRHCQEAPR